MIETSIGIKGLQEAQDVNLRIIEAFEPGGVLGKAVKVVTIALHRYLASVTHVDSGAYRASHRVTLSETRGRIFVDPSAVNPRGKLVTSYAPIEEARGGSHAAYQRTMDEMSDYAAEMGVAVILRELP